MKKLKLSELDNDIEIGIEGSNIVYTVAELKGEIIELNEPHHESSNWVTLKRRKWNPNALSMIQQYIESECDEMYEDWDERAMECVTDDFLNRMQSVLNDAFNWSFVTDYFECQAPVEIDVFPKEKEGER